MEEKNEPKLINTYVRYNETLKIHHIEINGKTVKVVEYDVEDEEMGNHERDIDIEENILDDDEAEIVYDFVVSNLE